jgi:hypothetical protein
MPNKTPVKSCATSVPKVLNLLEACRVSCHASAAAITNQLSKATAAQRAVHFQATDASGWTPLLYAARNGWPDVVEQCLAAGQNSNPHTARLQSSGNTGMPRHPLPCCPADTIRTGFCSICREGFFSLICSCQHHVCLSSKAVALRNTERSVL